MAYISAAGAIICTICPAGFTCTDNITPQSCTSGFCPSGSIDAIACPNGYTCTTTTSVIPAVCPDGTYSDPTGTNLCITCPAGYYCVDRMFAVLVDTGYYSLSG